MPLFNLKSALLYLAIGAMANPAAADLASLLTGDMAKLALHETARPGSDVPFTGADGAEMTLASYADQMVVLNFWATWCAPCRHEMPQLSALQDALGGDGLTVVTVATGRNAAPAIDRFFSEIGVTNLPKHTDPRQALARAFGITALPATLILNSDGQEIARMEGEADWASDNAIALLTALSRN